MKFKLIAMTITCGTLALPALAADTYQIGPDKSKVRFTIMNKPPGKDAAEEVPGTFGDFAGTVLLNAQDPAKSSVQMEIKTASVDTGIAKRDDHLRSADFFEAEKFPDISVVVTAADVIDGDTVGLHAELTIKGTTKPLTLKTKVTPVGDGTMRLSTQATVNRQDFGVDGNIMGMVGDNATVSGDVVFRRAG